MNVIFTTETATTSIHANKNILATDVNSTVVTEWWYHADYEVLVVTYKGGAYRYAGVPYSVAVGLMNTTSVGKYLNTEVKGKYEYSKMED
jgi:hypothetical protein